MAKAGKAQLEAAKQALRSIALSYPETVEEFPWGESAFKVKRKVFLFMHGDTNTLSLSTKLPHSASVALSLPFAEPTGYGLGKSGWVSATFTATQSPPIDLLRAWVDESFCAIAPARLVASMLAAKRGEAAAAPKKPAKRARKAPQAKPKAKPRAKPPRQAASKR